MTKQLTETNKKLLNSFGAVIIKQNASLLLTKRDLRHRINQSIQNSPFSGISPEETKYLMDYVEEHVKTKPDDKRKDPRKESDE